MSEDLARLIVRLEAQTAQYDKALKDATRTIEGFRKKQTDTLGKITSSFKSFGALVGGGLVAGAVGRAMSAIVNSTVEAEKSFAMLQNAVRQSGGVAGFTAERLSKIAGELQNVTTFGDDAIMSMQQLLLRFTAIRGDEFDRAQRSVLDLASALSMDLDAAAKLVGKALQNPEKGLQQLTRAGVTFTAQQKEQVKALLDSGRVAEAQQVIIGALEKSYGGAAAAARNTLGGALASLKNAFGDLLEGKGGVSETTAALNKLTDTLQKDSTKQAFSNIAAAFLKSMAAAVELMVKAESILDRVATRFGKEVTGLRGSAKEALQMELRFEQLKLSRMDVDSVKPEAIASQRAYVETLKQRIALLDQIRAPTPKTEDAPPPVKPATLNDIGIDEDGEGGRSSKGLDLEVRITSTARAIRSAMDELYDGIDERTATVAQEQSAALAKLQVELDALAKERGMAPEEYRARFSQAVRGIVGDTRTAAEQQVEQIERVRSALKALEEAGVNTAEQSKAQFAEALEGIVGDTRTAAERQQAEIGQIYARLKLLKDNGLIDAQTLTERYAEAVDRIQGKTEELSQYMIQAQRNTVDIIADTIESGFDGGFKGVLLSFAKMLRSMAAQAAAANLGKVLFGEGGMTPGSIKQGSAGILGDLIKIGASAFGGMFGGGSIGLSASQTSSMLSSISSSTAGAISAFKLPGYATGGSYPGTSPFIAGEFGPELVFPGGQPGRVFNTRDTQRMSGGASITLNINGVRDADSFRKAEGHIRASMAAAYQRSISRDN